MKDRSVNGYRLIYKPDHPSSYQEGNHRGYVYEHIYVMELELGRCLTEGEHVHHLDGVKDHNLPRNLIVLSNSHHRRLHNWLDKGAPFEESNGKNRVNSEKPKLTKCLICSQYLSQQKKFCSKKCELHYRRSRSKCPSPEELEKTLEDLRWNYSAAGRHYGVSDNTVRQWCVKCKVSKATPSQAEDTSSEGVETTGEV